MGPPHTHLHIGHPHLHRIEFLMKGCLGLAHVFYLLPHQISLVDRDLLEQHSSDESQPTHLSLIMSNFIPQSSPDRTGKPQHGLNGQRRSAGTHRTLGFVHVHRLLDTPFEETPQVLWKKPIGPNPISGYPKERVSETNKQFSPNSPPPFVGLNHIGKHQVLESVTISNTPLGPLIYAGERRIRRNS
jgi:hypothetical protein